MDTKQQECSHDRSNVEFTVTDAEMASGTILEPSQHGDLGLLVAFPRSLAFSSLHRANRQGKVEVSRSTERLGRNACGYWVFQRVSIELCKFLDEHMWK